MTYFRGSANSREVSLDLMLHWISYCLLLVGISALTYSAYVFTSARYFQAAERARFENTAVQLPVAPRVVMDGDVIGEIQVSRLRLNAIVVQGDSDEILSHAVGHVLETALPGQAGNIALAGHRDTLFRPLRDIQIGDTVTLRTTIGDHSYRVNKTEVVPPSDIGVLQSGEANELTLITCFPFHYIGHAPNRFIVHASEVQR